MKTKIKMKIKIKTKIKIQTKFSFKKEIGIRKEWKKDQNESEGKGRKEKKIIVEYLTYRNNKVKKFAAEKIKIQIKDGEKKCEGQFFRKKIF